MKTIGKDSRKLRVVGALSLFFFIFLGMEYLFVNMMGLVTDVSGAVAAQSYILGASVIGFLLFPFINRKCNDNRKTLFVFGMALVVVICIFVVWQHSSYITILFSGCLLYTLLGIVGSMVCYMVVKTPGSEDYLGRIAGMGYALGIFLQFLNNNLVRDDTTESIVLAVAFAVLAVLLLKITDDIYSPDANVFGFEELENQIPSEKSQQQLAPNLSGGRLVHESKSSQNLTENRDCDSWQLKNPLVAGLLLVVIVILMSCIFATLDNAVTLAHAEGSIDVGQWPRLFLATSGLAAGVLFDLRRHTLMHLIMYCITILSVLCIVSIEMSGLLYIGLMIFYVSAGFFAIYLMTSFMSFSIKTEKPDVWAGLGRAINNLSAVITTLPAITLLGSKMNVTIIVTALILFVLISIFMVLYFLQYRHVDEKEEEIPQNVLEDEELFEAFSDAYSLTPKEKEVLRLLLTTEDNIQDIAEQLFISRAALYRHIGSLNEKTETKSRIGILQCYYKWNGKS